MCIICGQPDYLRCNCESQQPFCDQCAEDTRCTSKMDAQCVIYHFNTQIPSQLTCLGIPNGANLETILEAIDDLVCNSFNIPFEPEDSESIYWEAGGPAGHKPQAHVRISPDDENGLVIRENGLYATGDGKVKVDAADEPDYLENQIEGGSSPSGIITNTVVNVGGLLQVIPSIDIAVLLTVIREQFSEQFCEILSECNCFLSIENLAGNFAAACPVGYELNPEETLCVREEEEAATISEDIVNAVEARSNSWNAFGTLLFTNTNYLLDGRGPDGLAGNSLATDISNGDVILMSTANVWQNVAHAGAGTPDDLDGPLNRAGVWRSDADTNNSAGFTLPINVPVTKTYFIGISGDNDVFISVTPPSGSPVPVIDTRLTVTDGGSATAACEAWYAAQFPAQGPFFPFRTWNIYPIVLTAGINYVTLTGVSTGGDAGFAAEIYDNTLAEIQAAALSATFLSQVNTFPNEDNPYDNLDLVFTTRCGRSPSSFFTVGNATCPDSSWTLDASGGNPLVAPCQSINVDPSEWVCRRTLTTAFSGYTVTLVWDRIEAAIDYQVQQKLSSDPDSSYVDASTSPVANPGSGTTVNTIITGLASDQMDFRVRANFEDCSTDWTVLEA